MSGPLGTRLAGDGVTPSSVQDSSSGGPPRSGPPRLAVVPPLADIYRRHAKDVGRWAARLGGPRVDVDDVVQEVFIIAARKLDSFRGDAKLGTWLFRITDHVVRNHRRWWRVRRVLTPFTDRHSEQLASADIDPLETLERRTAATRAFRVLDRLPEKQRRVLVMQELEELPAEEIAELLEARVETVRVWLHRARRSFLKSLQQLEDEEGRLP
jgi:RNA polymerase sigma-70 factor (ECF subfamily)